MANVAYHPNTVLSILEKGPRNTNFDAKIVKNESNWQMLTIENGYLDDDKVYTLTLCRFEASTLEGSTKVLVADADEFLYCANGALNFAGQGYVINNVMDKYASIGVSQITFYQLMTAAKLDNGKYSSVGECLYDKVTKKKSIFDCHAGYEYNTGFGFQGKSIHLHHTCPLTDYHQGCNNQYCKCPVKIMPYAFSPGFLGMPQSDHCFFMHLSSNADDYGRKYDYLNDSRTKYEVTPSELSAIVNGKKDYTYIRIH